MEYNFYGVILIILGVTLLVSGMTTFWKGHHNVDLGANLEYRNCMTGDYWLDEGSDHKTRTGRELYILGLSQYEQSLLYIIPACFMVGLGVALAINREVN